MAKDIREFAHPSYIEVLPDYQTIRDCFKGDRAIKAGGVAYLPRLSGQSDDDYNNYRRRALFFPITGKTATTMVGLATTKPPKTTYPTTMESYFIDTEAEYQFTEFYVTLMQEVILMGRYGVLIDAPTFGDPKLVPYIAENIINWDTDEHGNLTMVLLQEYTTVLGEDKFKKTVNKQYRCCEVIDSVYTVTVYDENMAPTSITQPAFSGGTIDYIPFTCFGASGIHMGVDKPPMLDISTINISHYMTSADLEWGRHLTGLPTPVVSGVDSGTSLRIGGTAAWILPDPAAKAYYMEFLGQGLQSLEKAMTEKVSLMASISARLVDNSTRGSEAAETVRLRYMSESASLIHIINHTEAGLNRLYNALAVLAKAGGTVSVRLSREIVGMGITFGDLATLFDAYFQGGISKETLLFNLRRLDVVDPDRSDEDELGSIRNPDPIKTPAAATLPATA